MVAGLLNIHRLIEKLKFRLQGIKIFKSCVEFLRNFGNHFPSILGMVENAILLQGVVR
jgi:hypothetical protein